MSSSSDNSDDRGSDSSGSCEASVKCVKCGRTVIESEDSFDTVEILGLCEDCMTQFDWDRFYALSELDTNSGQI